MKNLWQSFLLLLSGSGESELAQQIQYLKVENDILRKRLPHRIRVTAKERQRLLRFGKPLGNAIWQLVSIVSPRTFLRWMKPTHSTKSDGHKPGRPRTDEQLRDLILRLAQENSWGYTRIHGELKKLGLDKVSRTTVANILREQGIDTAPQRGKSTWKEFIKRHADTLLACDFFSKKVWTLSGLKTYYILFFIHIGSRRIHLSGFTTNPDRAWMIEQAKAVSGHFPMLPVKPTHLIRDRDSKFVPQFDDILEGQGIGIKPTAPRQPNQNAYAERVVLSIKTECLDHFCVFGEAHLQLLLAEYEQYANQERPHQGLGNKLISGETAPPAETASAKEVVCSERLGGVLKHYHHRAAA